MLYLWFLISHSPKNFQAHIKLLFFSCCPVFHTEIQPANYYLCWKSVFAILFSEKHITKTKTIPKK